MIRTVKNNENMTEGYLYDLAIVGQGQATFRGFLLKGLMFLTPVTSIPKTVIESEYAVIQLYQTINF